MEAAVTATSDNSYSVAYVARRRGSC